MSSVSSGGASRPPQSTTIAPGKSESFNIGYYENTVLISNPPDAEIDGGMIYVWLYTDTNPVTPVQTPIPSGSSVPLNPVVDSSGNRAQVLVVMNTGQAPLTAGRRSG